MGGDFGISEAPWEVILSPRDHPGGPWEQQDGHEVANDRILVDFELIAGLVYVGFLIPKCIKNVCLLGFFVVAISDSIFDVLEFKIVVFALKVLHKPLFHGHRF